MTKYVYMLIGMLIGAVAVTGSLKYHILRTDDGLTVVPKQDTTLSETYVDIRNFGVSDWIEHRAVAAALIKAKKEHLMQESVTDSWKGKMGEVVEQFTGQTPAPNRRY